MPSTRSTTASVTSTAAVDSAMTRRKRRAPTGTAAVSPTTLTSACAPGRPSSSSSCGARPRHPRDGGLARWRCRNATRVASTAAVTSRGHGGAGPRQARRAAAGGEEGEQQLALQPNISFSSSGSAWSKPSRCRMPCVVSSSSSSSVAWPGRRAPARSATSGTARCRRAARRASVALAAGAQLVHREAQHVGGPGLVHPLHVQRLHRGLVDERDRTARPRGARASGVEHVARARATSSSSSSRDSVSLSDLDAHRRGPVRAAVCVPAAVGVDDARRPGGAARRRRW